MFKFLFKTFKDKDLRKRIIFTLVMLIVFRIGASITVPGVSLAGENTFGDNDFFGMINLLGGGALAQFSLFALGVSPYITASIVIQLLSADVVPSLARRAKKGEKGKQELEVITKWVTVIFAAVQAWALTTTMQSQGIIQLSGFSLSFIVLILMAGTMVTMWLGDQITKKGIGNGVSFLILAGIVSSMPYQFQQTFSILVDVSSTSTLFVGLLNFLGFIVLYIGIILLIISVSGATRKIPIQKSGTSTQGDMSFMPIKLNSVGVIPIIFASSIITAPTVIMSGMADSDTKWFLENLLSLNNTSGFIIYAVLIFLFTFFYSNYVAINPEQLAKSFHEQDLYIPGIKPGKSTYIYVRKILNRLNLFGALYLVLIVALPIYVPKLLKINSTLPIGGTSLIILISVALEVYKQIDGRLSTAAYSQAIDTDENGDQPKQKKPKLSSIFGGKKAKAVIVEDEEKKDEENKDGGGLIW